MVAKQIPVSMDHDGSVTVDGQAISFVTPSGIYVAQEKYDVKQIGVGRSWPSGTDNADGGPERRPQR